MKIWLIWRVNVGKSTLFNRLSWNYRAIVTDIPWTTREIISQKIKLTDDKVVELIDSPWLLDFNEEIVFIEKIIKDSDLLIFVLDWKEWLTSSDNIIKDVILKYSKKEKTILVVNKLDWNTFWNKTMLLLSEFFSLWFEHVLPLSAKNNENIDNLIDQIIDLSQSKKLSFDIKMPQDNAISFAIVWRPNVWKSTLINKLAQEEIASVSDVAWTTLDYLTAETTFQWKLFRIYDTAWIRKKWKIHWLERIALDKTTEMIKYIKPIVIILVDIVEWITHRDLSLIWDIIKLDVPIVLAVNKVDAIPKNELDKYFKNVTKFLDFARWIPIIPISSNEWTWLPILLKAISKIALEQNKSISTSDLNQVINSAWMNKPPRFPKNKSCKVLYWLQKETNPPKFLFFVNKADNANFSFKKWLDNVLRREYWFIWVPLKFEFKEK